MVIPMALYHEFEWNDIIRNVLFKDDELRRLMMVPSNCKILDFIDNYFVRSGGTGPLLTNQHVRIVYGSNTIGDDNNPGVLNNQISFNIYVKNTNIHDSENDRLIYRTVLIAERLKYLLMHNRYIRSYRFWVAQEQDMYTSLVDYNRYMLTLNYMKVV